MRGLVIYACILVGLFYFSEGKPCPEKTRPHKTRCDTYYKCRVMPSNSHVWVPTKCNEGLVYEHNVGSCVLPGEDWECLTASELASTTTNRPEDNDILIVSSDENEYSAEVHKYDHDDDNVEIVRDGALSSEEEQQEQPKMRTPHDSEQESQQSSISLFDSSGDGELVELEAFLPTENRHVEVSVSNHSKQGGDIKLPLRSQEQQAEVHLLQAELKPSSVKPNSPIDPKLTAHLQRLSQLIDGLKQTYQQTDKPQAELRPDQLNAFLAHFDIKNRFEALSPGSNYRAETSTATPVTIATTPGLPEPSANKTLLQQHLSNKHMKPETKLMLTNALPHGYGYTQGGGSGPGQGYANSQIVVNRPEGSVMFTLPHYGLMPEQQQQHQQQLQTQPSSHEHNEPKISEETLKTVLELSKQMIAAQNLPKVIPNPAYNAAYYAPPILQPVILSPQGNPYQQYYGPPLQQSYEKPLHYGQRKKPHHGSSSSGGYNKPGTTIIHNNVIPVHVASTNSGEKEVLDTYGNSLGMYPHINHLYNNSHNNNYYGSMTTARPAISVTTVSAQYSDQYGSQFTLTTPHPFEQQPPPATVAGYYTPSPHLSDRNVNRVFQTESYPTMNMGSLPRPMNEALFPAQLNAGQVKIRPNSQKIESMEVEADEMINANGNGNNVKHVLTYSGSSNMEMEGNAQLSQQLAPGAYVEQSYANKSPSPTPSPYMPRPTAMSTGIYSDNGGNLDMSIFNSFAVPNTYQALPTPSPGKLKRPLLQHSPAQLVNFDGSFISLDVFQKSILPLLTRSPSALAELGKVELITCQAGVRQPNATDCTRYFVCSKKDGKVLSYSCPPYTGFNTQSRICDAQTYAQCGTLPMLNSYSIEENRRMQMEALKALSEAKRRQEAALKAQSLTSLLQQYGGGASSSQELPPASSIEKDMLDSYAVSTPSPAPPAPSPALPPSILPSKKRKYYCKEGDKIPDQTSISSYFVCYKNAEGQMKGHKMTCSKGLLFCPKTLLCTLPSKCT